MKTSFSILAHFVLIALLTASCASGPKNDPLTITPIENGVYTGEQVNFPILISNKNVSKNDVKKEMGEDVLYIYQGVILDAKKSKEENLKSLSLIKLNQYDLVNLNLSDLLVAKTQDINLDNTGLKFLNTSIEDIKNDSIYKTKNITPFALHKTVVILGLSNSQVNQSPISEEVINDYNTSDYALSILKIRKEISLLKETDPKNKNKKIKAEISSFIIVHDIPKEIDALLERLPPYFMNY